MVFLDCVLMLRMSRFPYLHKNPILFETYIFLFVPCRSWPKSKKTLPMRGKKSTVRKNCWPNESRSTTTGRPAREHHPLPSLQQQQQAATTSQIPDWKVEQTLVLEIRRPRLTSGLTLTVREAAGHWWLRPLLSTMGTRMRRCSQNPLHVMACRNKSIMRPRRFSGSGTTRLRRRTPRCNWRWKSLSVAEIFTFESSSESTTRTSRGTRSNKFFFSFVIHFSEFTTLLMLTRFYKRFYNLNLINFYVNLRLGSHYSWAQSYKTF